MSDGDWVGSEEGVKIAWDVSKSTDGVEDDSCLDVVVGIGSIKNDNDDTPCCVAAGGDRGDALKCVRLVDDDGDNLDLTEDEDGEAVFGSDEDCDNVGADDDGDDDVDSVGSDEGGIKVDCDGNVSSSTDGVNETSCVDFGVSIEYNDDEVNDSEVDTTGTSVGMLVTGDWPERSKDSKIGDTPNFDADSKCIGEYDDEVLNEGDNSFNIDTVDLTEELTVIVLLLW